MGRSNVAIFRAMQRWARAVDGRRTRRWCRGLVQCGDWFASCRGGCERVAVAHAVSDDPKDTYAAVNVVILINPPLYPFLSCLRGSEHDGMCCTTEQQFISCLRGSERQRDDRRSRLLFLSCLHGSERLAAHCCNAPFFLSCLRGSEPSVARDRAHLFFLSCLRGSELAKNDNKPLIRREIALDDD
ncbi:conserved hypothetical protein [Burkholderia sp. 8Y]|nr:conserved hypothetical protein [Burkholderia sp. 8Y]